MANGNNGVLDGLRRIGAGVRDLAIGGGLPGAPLGYRMRGATQFGPPSSGTWKAGDWVPDRSGRIWICTVAGTPGTWVQAGGAYVPASGDTSGALDTARWQAALTAARLAGGAQLVKGAPGSTFTLLGNLVIGSNTTLDMTDCTINLVSPGTGALTRNYGMTVNAGTASDGAITSGTSVVTTALGASAVVGQTVVISAAGPTSAVPCVGLVSAQTSSNITFTNLDGTTLTAGTTVASGGTVTLFNRDSNVHVKGGYWNVPAGLGGITAANYQIVFAHVDHWSAQVQGMTTLSSGRFILNYDTTDGYVDAPNLSGNVTQVAGVYSVGPVNGLVVNRVTGITWDDLTCLSCTDQNAGLALLTSGSIKDVDFRYINGTSSHDNSCRIVGSPGLIIDQVRFGLVEGASSGIYIGDYSPAGTSQVGGSFGYIDCGVIGVTGATNALTLQCPKADEIRVVLALPAGTVTNQAVFITGATTTATINTLRVSGVHHGATVVGHNTGTVTVGNLILDGVSHIHASGGAFTVQLGLTGAAITGTTFLNCDVQLNTSSDVVQIVSGATMGMINFIGGIATAMVAYLNDAGIGNTTLTFSGGHQCTTTQYVAIYSGASGTKTVNFGEAKFAAVTVHDLSITGTAPVTVVTGSTASAGINPLDINLSASQSVTALSLAVHCDISKLVRTGVGDLVYNTNASLTAHTGAGNFLTGPCISTGGNAAGSWISLINPTYTY